MWLWISFCLLPVVFADRFTEELLLTRIQSDNMLAQFRFVMYTDGIDIASDYDLFPRIMGEMIDKYGIRELSLVLSQGVWRSEQYGPAPQPSSTTGALIHAWMEGGNETSIDSTWSSLINSLNGVFCTSLVDVVPTLTYNPKGIYQKRGSLPPSSSSLSVRAASLARESVCTENLTPWRKLLPCKQNGLVTLLNPSALYSAPFYSMGLQMYPVCEGKNKCGWRLELFTTVLFDLPLATRSKDWSLHQLFGRSLVGKCSVAEKSTVVVMKEKGMSLTATPQSTVSLGTKEYCIFNTTELIGEKSSVDLGGNYEEKIDMTRIRQPGEVRIFSTIGGADQFSGRLVSVIRNHGRVRHAVYSQMLPWWIRVFYHSITYKCHGLKGEELSSVITSRHWQSSNSRVNPAYLELHIDVPMDSECTVEMKFEKGFLRMIEYPPDANHGLYLPGAQLKIDGVTVEYPGNEKETAVESLTNQKLKSNWIVLHSNVLLIPMPVPDFSMPFNVICFVATAISLCFGPVHSFSTKMLIPVGVHLPRMPTIRRLFRMFLLVLLALAAYAQYHNMGVNEIKRAIEKQLEKLNSLQM